MAKWFKKAGVSNGPVTMWEPGNHIDTYDEIQQKRKEAELEQRRQREAAIELAKIRSKSISMQSDSSANQANAGNDRTTAIRIPEAKKDYSGLGYLPTYRGMNEAANGADVDQDRFKTEAATQKGWKGFGSTAVGRQIKGNGVTEKESLAHAEDVMSKYNFSDKAMSILDEYVAKDDESKRGGLWRFESQGSYSGALMNLGNKFKEETGVSDEEFTNIFESYSRLKHAKERKDQQQEYADMGSTERVAKSLVKAPKNVLGGYQALIGSLQNPSDPELGRDYNSEFFRYSNENADIRKAQNDVINEIKDPVVRTLAHYGYNAGVMGVESATAALTGEAGLGSFFASGYNTGLKDAEDRGLSPAQSQAYALAAGSLEYFTERIPWEGLKNIWAGKAVSKDAVKGSIMPYIKALFKQKGSEALEEVINGVGDIIADGLISGDKSKLNNSIQYYIQEEGLSEEEATRKAIWDVVKETADAAITASISAGVSAGPALASQAYTVAKAGRNIASIENKTGNLTKNAESEDFIPENREAYVADEDYNQAQQTRQSIKEASEKVEKGQRISGREARALAESYATTAENIDTARRAKAVEQIERRQEAAKEVALKSIKNTTSIEELETIKERNARDEAVVAAVEEKEAQMIEQGATTKEEIENVITPRKAFETAKEGNVIEEEKLESLPVETKLAYQYGKEAANDIKGSDLSDVDVSSIENKSAKPGKRVQKIKDVKVNQRNELVFTTEDGTEINAYEANYTDKGKLLYKGENGILSLNKPSLVKIAMEAVEQGNYTGAITNLTTAIRTMDTLGRTQGINFEDALKSYGYMQDAVGKDILEQAFNAHIDESKVFDEAKKVGRVRKGERGLIREQTAENEAAYTSQFGNKDIEALLKQEHIAYSADNTEEAIRSFEDLSDAQKDFLDSFSSRTGVDFDFIFTKEGGIRGTYAPSTGKIILNLAYSNNMFEVALHEGIGEFLQAHNAKAYNAISESILNYYASTQADKLAEKIRNYQRTYKNLKYRESANELVNDALGQIFSTDEGLKELTRWLDENETEAQSKKVKKTFLDYFNDLKNMIKDIKSKGGLKEGDAKALTMAEKDAAKFAKQLTAAMNEAITTRDAQAELTGAKEGNDARFARMLEKDEISFITPSSRNLYTDKKGNIRSDRDAFKKINGKSYKTIDGDVIRIEKTLYETEAKDVCDEFYRKRPSRYNGINDIDSVDRYIKGHIKDFIENSVLTSEEEIPVTDHSQYGIETFDERTVGFIFDNESYVLRFIVANMNDGRKVLYAKRSVDSIEEYIKQKEELPLGQIPAKSSSEDKISKNKNNATPKQQKSAKTQNKGGGKSLDVEQKAIEHFGTTKDFKFAGYMLPDGQLLDFSGAHWLDGASEAEKEQFRQDNGMRQVDHDDIYEVMEASGDNRKQFMDRGNIRLNPEAPGFNISSKIEPTAAQYRELKEFIREVKRNPYYDASNFYVDIEDTHPNKISYANNLNEDRIINDIKKYYETGEMPQQSSLNDFRYSFAGFKAETADLYAVTEADKMRSEGKSMEEIFAKTGWYLGNDDKWRYEISNKDARLYLDGDALLADTEEHKHYRELVDYINSSKDMGDEWMKAFDEVGKYIDNHKIGSNKKEYRLEEILKHDELFEAYPSLRRIKISIEDLPAGTNGRFNPKTNTIELSETLKRVGQNPLKRTLFHELQHAIQQLEGFAHGSSPEFWNLRGLPQYTKEEDIKAYEDAKKKVDDLREKLPENFLKKYDKYVSLMREYAGHSTDLDLYEQAQRLYKLLQDEDKAALEELDDAYWELDFAFPTPSEMLASEAYYATAGEIEAREVADRIDMTEEERRSNLPKMTDEKGRVVFAENATTPWRYPTGDDFRFSKAVFGEESQYSSQIEQTQFVSQILSTLNNQLKGTSVSMPYINDTVKYILDKYQADLNPDEFTMELAQFIAYMTANEQVDYNQMMNYLLNIGDEVIQASNLKDPEEVRIYSELKKELSSHKINLTDLERKELISKFGGSWNAVFGKLNEIGIKLNKAGQHMDGSTYSEIVDKFREIAGVQLDEEKGAVDQIATIIDAMDALKPSAYKWEGATDMDKALDVATTIIDRYYSMATSIKESNIVKGTEKGAAAVERAKQQEIKKLRAKQQEYKAKVNEEFKQLVEDRKKVIEEQQAFYRRQAEIERQFRGEKRAYEKKVNMSSKELEKTARLQAQMQYKGIKETEAKRKNKENIVRTCMRLINWMNKPTDTRHVPTFLKPALTDLIKSINFMPASMRKGDDGTISAIKWQESMRKLQQVIRNINSADVEATSDADKVQLALTMDGEDIADKMQQLLDKYGGTADISRMKAEDLKILSDIMTSISKGISKMNENFMNRRYKHVGELAEASMDQMMQLKAISDTTTVFKDKAADFLNLDMLEPISFFEELGEASASIMQEFFDGEKIGIEIIREAEDFFDDLAKELNISKADIRSWSNDTKNYNIDGGTIALSSADIMSLYCSYKREMLDQQERPYEATHHIAAGGIKGYKNTYKKGKGLKKYVTNRNARALHANEGKILELINSLDVKQQAYADKVVDYMSTRLAAHGNETSNKMNGYSKFLGKYYFPLKTENNAIATTESNSQTGLAGMLALVHQSFTKSQLDKADNALVVMDFFDVVTEHITGMANYCAYSMPLSDALRWYNYASTERNNTENENEYLRDTQSIKGHMDRVKGKNARTYFENFLRAVNLDPAKNGGSALVQNLARVLTGLGRAKAIALNGSVWVQQPTAITRAADVIEDKYLAEGWAKMSLNPKAACEYAQKTSYLCYWKNKGFSDYRVTVGMKEIITGHETKMQELRELAGAPAGILDDTTWAAMYYAAENKIKDTTNLKEGTEEFHAAVEELFSDIINHTQVIDSNLRTTQTMKGRSDFEYLANAFKKEPQKTYNMLHRSYWRVYQYDTPEAKRKWHKTLRVFTITNIVNALFRTIFLTIRDDEDESFLKKYLKKLFPYESYEAIKKQLEKPMDEWSNKDLIPLLRAVWGGKGAIGDNMDILSSMPIIAEIDSWFQGFSPSTLSYTSILTEANKTVNSLSSATATPYNLLYAVASFSDYVTGLGISNLMRDLRGFWNQSTRVTGLPRIEKSSSNEAKASKTKQIDALEDAIDSAKVAKTKEEKLSAKNEIDAAVDSIYQEKYNLYISDKEKPKTEEEAAKEAKEQTARTITTNFKPIYKRLVADKKLDEATTLMNNLIYAYGKVGYKKTKADFDEWLAE